MKTQQTPPPEGLAPLTGSAFARRLREARKIARLTQEDLGKRTGLNATAISHLESGRRTPCMGNLIKLCQALRVSADDLLGLNQAENIAINQDHPRCTCGRAILAGELAKGACYCGAVLKTNSYYPESVSK